MARPEPTLWYPVLGGQNDQHIETLRQDPELLELDVASNVVPDPLGAVATRDGFSHVRASAISGTPAITGMSHKLRDVADKLILTGSDGKAYEDSANPPTAKAGGTDFSTGADNLTRFDVHEQMLVMVSRLRDLPQTINSSGTKADLGGTPPRGLDYRVFGRRGFMFAPIYSSTTYPERISFNSANDDHDAWANPVTTNFLNLGRPGSGVQVVGGEVHADHLMAYTSDKVFPIYTTPNATLPFAFRKEVFSEEGGGPVGAHALVSAADSVFWISQNFDVKQQTGFAVKSVGYPIQPFLRGLSNSRRAFIVGGWEPKYRMVVWQVSDGSDTQHKDMIGLQVDTGQFFFFTLQCNALANRVVSGELRLIGGHYHGLFSNLFDGSTAGDLQTAATAINASLRTPRLHLGKPFTRKKVPYAVLQFDPIATETVTLDTYYDDSTSADETTTVALSGTDLGYVTVELTRPFQHVQFAVSDANSGERFRLMRVGFPAPLITYAQRT